MMLGISPAESCPLITEKCFWEHQLSGNFDSLWTHRASCPGANSMETASGALDHLLHVLE